jgi:hypothetical protein
LSVLICTDVGSVLVRQIESGEQLDVVRIDNDPLTLGLEIAKAGPGLGVVLEGARGAAVGEQCATCFRCHSEDIRVTSPALTNPASQQARHLGRRSSPALRRAPH